MNNPVEYIPEQINLLNGTSPFVHFQIPYERRSSGVVPSSLEIIYQGNKIVDDGDGNLIDPLNDDIVGNIFYNSGNIFILSDDYFHDTNIQYKDVASNETTINYEREVNFIQNKYFIDIDQDEYTFSTNSTFKDSDVDSPFLTTIYLYNDRNELIAKANLSKPVSTENDLFIVLDDLETV